MWLILFGLFNIGFWPTVISAQNQRQYEGYKVYDLTIDSMKKLNYIKKYDGADGYDFWKLPQRGNANLMVAPPFQSNFEADLKKNHIVYSMLIKNVAETLPKEAETEIAARLFETEGEFDFTYFPRYDEMINFMESLVKKRKYSRTIKIGSTFEGRPIYGIEVTKSPDKPVFFIDAGIHAREWASQISALNFIKILVDHEEMFADMMNFVVIPCVNPDGYEYSHTTDRLWRKSLSEHATSQCRGVDLNRNFDSHWQESNAETNPCTETYGGPKPFSEPETIALGNSILKYKPVAYLTIHSFGPLLIYPYGYTKDLPPNWKTLQSIGTKAAEMMKKYHGTEFVVGSAARVLYVASGGSDDWAYDEAKVPIVFTMELPEVNNQSFMIPKSYIRPIVNETLVGVLTIIKSVYLMYKK